MWFILFPFIKCRWSGAYEAHVAHQDVEELRKFIQACFSDELSDPGLFSSVRQNFVADDPGIEVQFEHHAVADLILGHEFFFSGFGVHVHASEFVHLEFSSVSADSLLGEEDWTWGVYVDNRTNCDHDQQGDQASYKSSGNVHHSFDSQFRGICIVHACGDHYISTYFFYLLAA